MDQSRRIAGLTDSGCDASKEREDGCVGAGERREAYPGLEGSPACCVQVAGQHCTKSWQENGATA
jgi:hypothetical protein